MAVDVSESGWKAFTKKQKLAVELDDKELLKALARFDKTSEGKPEPRLEALKDLAKEVLKQITALAKLKKQLGDKPFGLVKDELYAILEEAESLQKKTQAALEAGGEQEEDDEDSAPTALVDPKLLFKQLGLCRKDPERTMKFAFVDAKGKEQPAMLAMHPRTGARALFGKLQAAAGVRTGAYGSAWVDGTSLMLQLDKPLSGLVKKLRAPVKACGFRITKVVLWNADGTVFEQDEQAEDAVAGRAAPETREVGPGAEAEPSTVTPTAQNRGGPTAPPQPSITYEAELAALLPRVKKAADEGSVDATKHQKLLAFAAVKAGSKDFLGALAALKHVDQLLDNPTAKGSAEAGGAGAATGAGSGGDAGTAVPAPSGQQASFDEAAFRASWQTAREGWTAAIEQVDAQIAKLQAALREDDDEDLVAIAEFGLPALTGDFKAPMMAAVMDVDRASGDGLARAARRARSLAASFAEYLDEAETVAVTDDNDFGVTVTIRKTVGGALRQLEQTLAQAAG